LLRNFTRVGLLRPALFGAMLAAACAAGCYSSNYRRELGANVALIADLADKLSDYCRSDFTVSGRSVSSEEMGEFYYALKKARAYAAMTHNDASRRSHRDFERMLAAYAAFVRAADEYRLAGARDPAKLQALLARHDSVSRLAAQVSADLAAGD
jgi:hypothetical protein